MRNQRNAHSNKKSVIERMRKIFLTSDHISDSSCYSGRAFTRKYIPTNTTALSGASGAIAGCLTGIVVSVPEHIKIALQSEAKVDWAKEFRKIPKSIIPFAAIFSALCALEFTANHWVKKNYGPWLGAAAGGLTGAIFLTPADHLMYMQRQRITGDGYFQTIKKVLGTRPYYSLWTGITPMIAREFSFIASVAVIGPNVGHLLRRIVTGKTDPTDGLYGWSFGGRICSGVMTSMASQPFDAYARWLQIEGDQSKRMPSYQQAWRKQASLRGIWRGAMPRMVLATCGGAMVGAIYDLVYHCFLDQVNDGNTVTPPTVLSMNGAALFNQPTQKSGAEYALELTKPFTLNQ